jgi:hypothetical protein
MEKKMLRLLKKLFTKKKKTTADLAIPKNLDTTRETESPCGRYRTRIDSFKTGSGTWNITRGTVLRNSDDQVIAVVHRNYSSFTHSWVGQGEKTYLLTGEHYQGQTVVDCETGEVSTTNPDETDGWCWAEHKPSPNGKIVAVCGCYWGCPYHWQLFDFSNPTATPLPEIKCEYLEHQDGEWIDNETFVNREFERYSKETGESEEDMGWEEYMRHQTLSKEIGEETTWTRKCIGEKFARLKNGAFEIEETIVLPDEDDEDDED